MTEPNRKLTEPPIHAWNAIVHSPAAAVDP
jgi:hypothetical protein